MTQGDIDSGELTNTATVSASLVPSGDDDSGDAPDAPVLFAVLADDEPTSVSGEVTAVTALPQEPAITLAKSSVADTGDDDVLNIDETIAYSFTIANTGNVTLTNIVLVDPMEGLVFDGDTTIVSLAPGVEVTLTASYAVTQVDVDAGMIVNCADVTATAPDASDVEDLDKCATNLIDQNPALGIAWVCQDPMESWLPDVGDTATFEITVTNSGDQTVHQIAMETSREGALDAEFPTTLAPGEEVTRTWTTSVTQADYDAREIEVTVSFVGETESGAESLLASAIALQADTSVTATVIITCQMADLPQATPVAQAVTGLPETGHGSATAIPMLWAAAMISILALGAGSIGIRRHTE